MSAAPRFGRMDKTQQTDAGPETEDSMQQIGWSVDHFVGKQLQVSKTIQKQHFRGFHIDDQLELGRCL